MSDTAKVEGPVTRKAFEEKYGADIGDNILMKGVSTLGGAVLGGFIGNKIGEGNIFGTILGGVIGSVAMYKIAPEIATDIQRGNQSVDEQVEAGKSEGNLADRFSAVWQNLTTLGGQSVKPTMSTDSTPDV